MHKIRLSGTHGCRFFCIFAKKITMQLHIKTFRQLTTDELYAALAHIGVEVDDFLLKNEYFTRSKHEPIHGIGHIYRTMIGCALLGYLLQKPRIALLAFCGAYIHDLGRTNDYADYSHGEKAVRYHFDKFDSLWNKYQLTDTEKEWIKQAVIQHAQQEWMTKSDEGYDVMAILKDADALDRCRIGDLDPELLRFSESRQLIGIIEGICEKSFFVNNDISLFDFIKQYV